ncbi:hypothetical protein PPERSA_08100 [Pseudocohnilembus persalinus]|uniref:Uncharacterized protein n=1 Tax=Pseudocohnilembus persalinus TaxID=266149 RepID=A0A0V0R3K4_PSEPJ|nr:hypothetical protein PPERSA_08100 [Pseudocohnilembus persalinus]|eukprot:KRX08789.1 hypothetical protein PPERSA_08100 [Pseudocohnilembus persalinus]
MKEQEVDKGVLMRNCEKIILETLNLISVLKIDKQTIKIYEKSPFKRAVKGLIYFSLMALIQLFSVDIQKLSIHVLENHSNIFNQQKQKQSDSQANLDNAINIDNKQSYKPCSCSPQFTQNDDIKKIKHYIEIMKSQKLVGFIIEESQLKFYIDKWENLVLQVQWKSGLIFLKNDQSFQFEKAFKITETNFKFELPFGYSLTYCFINSKINLNIEQIEGDYDCNMIQTYRSLKQLEYLQGRILRYVRNKVMNFQRKESSLVPKCIKINIKSGKINVKEMQDFCDSDGLIGDKPRQIELNVDNLDLQIAYNQNDDILEQDLLLNIEEVDLNVDFLFNEKVNLAFLKSVKFPQILFQFQVFIQSL